ncbi:hypothetical protein M758_7G000400 [Ceratodon purpureus]|nr:hypothetical protein M758_7G000400 [Ceratodon purpureus]
MAAIHLGDLGNVDWSDEELEHNASEDCSDENCSSATEDENAAEDIAPVDYTPLELLQSHRARTSASCRSTASRGPYLRSQAADRAREFERHEVGSSFPAFRAVRGRASAEARGIHSIKTVETRREQIYGMFY